MKGLSYLLLVFCFLLGQSSNNFVLAFAESPIDDPLSKELGIRGTGSDSDDKGAKKTKKKKGKKGKHPKSQEVIIRPDGGKNILLELDRTSLEREDKEDEEGEEE